MTAAILAALAIGYLVGRSRRDRRRDHEPRAVRMLGAGVPAPRLADLVLCGQATFRGECAWCRRALEVCDEKSATTDPACRGWTERVERGWRPVPMPRPPTRSIG